MAVSVKEMFYPKYVEFFYISQGYVIFMIDYGYVCVVYVV